MKNSGENIGHYTTNKEIPVIWPGSIITTLKLRTEVSKFESLWNVARNINIKNDFK